MYAVAAQHEIHLPILNGGLHLDIDNRRSLIVQGAQAGFMFEKRREVNFQRHISGQERDIPRFEALNTLQKFSHSVLL